MPRRKKPKSILVVGRRWFRKTYGNTYHTATIYVDGECVHKSETHYGYGDHYVQTAWEWLVHAYFPKHLPLGMRDSAIAEAHGQWPRLWCEKHGIAFRYECADVAREKDL